MNNLTPTNDATPPNETNAAAGTPPINRRDFLAATAGLVALTSVASAQQPALKAAAPAPARVHVVAEGDSLTRISARYYGTTNRWQDIYDANRDVLKCENALRPGQRLKIP